MTHISAQVG